MIDNTDLLFNLIDDGFIRLNKSSILYSTPMPLGEHFNFEKVEGMLLGAAIGDSLGATSEGLSAEDRHKSYGEIVNYLPGRRSDFKPIGVPTDDTQLTYWTLKQLIKDNGFVADNVAKRFCKHRITGIGSTVKAFIHNYKDLHKCWYESGQDSLGNGALMRFSPVVVPYLKYPHSSLYADAALNAMITHNSYANNAACVAFTSILWQVLGMDSPPAPSWWLNEYLKVAKDLEGMVSHSSSSMPLFLHAEIAVKDAFEHGWSVQEACSKWGNEASAQWHSHACLFETVPSVLYILSLHGHDASEAIIRAVNDTHDNDTIGSIVGAIVGALHGLKGIHNEWIEGLTGRTRTGIDDAGEVFKLLLASKKAFWLK